MTGSSRVAVLGGLRVRLALAASLLVAAVAVAGAGLFSTVAQRELTREFESTMRSLAANFSRNAAHGVFIESGEVLQELANNLLAEPDVRRVVITNSAGKEILTQAKDGAPAGATGDVDVPVLYDPGGLGSEFAPFVRTPPRPSPPKTIGSVRVVYSRGRLENAIARVRARVWATAALAALVGSAIATWFAGRMIGPLRTLSDATSAVAAGDFETKVSESGGDEIGALAASFNHMIDALRVSRGKLEETYAELARKERLATLGQFTAVIAHELRNPLGVILSSAQVIMNAKRTPEQKERAAAFIVEEVRRLTADLTGFLAFARPKPPELKAFALADAATRAVEAFRGHPQEGATSPSVAARVVDEGAPIASADADQVHQLLLNLLINSSQAMSATTGNGRGGHVDVIVRTVEGRPAIVVADDGPGIPEDVRAHIFEPFFTTKKRGSGLGLAVVDQIARAHGGEVRLETEAGRGTRFTILFNAAASAAGANESTVRRSVVP